MFLLAHDPFGEPRSIPDQVRGKLFPIKVQPAQIQALLEQIGCGPGAPVVVLPLPLPQPAR